MNSCNLLDMGYQGQKLIWSNKLKRNLILERVDRGWVNPEWITMFPNSNLWHLPRANSGHCPLLMHFDNPSPRLGSKPFRFEPMWLLDDTFKEKIEQAWPLGGDDCIYFKKFTKQPRGLECGQFW